MDSLTTSTKFVVAVGKLLGSLEQGLGDVAVFRSLARQLGWELTDIPQPIVNLLPAIAQLQAGINIVIEEPTLTHIDEVQAQVSATFAAIKNLANVTYTLGFDATEFKQEFPQQLIEYLIINFLQKEHSRIYGILQVAGLVTQQYQIATATRPAYVRERFNLNLIADVLEDPHTFLHALYGGGTTAFLYDKLVALLTNLFIRLGFPTQIKTVDGQVLTDLNPTQLSDSLPEITSFFTTLFDTATSTGRIGAEISLLPLFNSVSQYEGVALALHATGLASHHIPLAGDYELIITGGSDLMGGVGIQFRPDEPLAIGVLGNVTSTISGHLEIALQQLRSPNAVTKHLLLRTPGNTELTYETITWKLGAQASTTATADIYSELRINALRFASGDGDNDSFLSTILKNFYFNTDLSVGISRAKGFYFDAAGGLSTKQIKNISLGPLQLTNVGVAVQAANGFTYLTVVSDVQAKLGPVQINVSEVGLKAGLKYVASGGDIGPFSVDIAFKSPTALGVAIETDTVAGGGYLYFDSANHRYAGVAQLTFKDKINLNAVGLLQTELPGNPEAYSFLLLITAQFNPIQLGLGFTLNAVGGIMGINRSLSVNYLRNLVQAGNMDSLLFPVNVLANPQLAVATVDNAFPAAEGRYVFGLMARIGWGTPNLITLDAALIIELPAPVRLALLGVLRAVLPNLNTPIIRLRADFLGIVDFGSKKISFDAVLVDSRILQFTLTGNLAFRLYQGDNPVFLLTAGGFHPAFQPPANADLPTLRRITLALSQGGDFRLTLSSYLAITTNTVQFGSRLDLYVGLPSSFYIEGYLAFDALFQFNPFRVQVQVGAGVAIKRNGSSKLSISLNLLLSGPGPWHVTGEGSFKILFFRIRFRVDRTFGSNASEPALPATDVRALLKAALEADGNWEIQPPAVRAASTTVLRTEQHPTELVVDPGGALLVRQKQVPLDYPVDVYGNTRPTNGSRFSISSAEIGETPNVQMITGAALGEVRDAFAPGQFRRMSDGEKLSAPSFQLMRSGLRLDVVDGLLGTGGTTRQVQFEMKVIEPAAAGSSIVATNPGASSIQQLVASTGGGTVGGRRTVSLSPAQFQGLARNGAVGRSRRSYEQRRPSRKAPDQVLWDEDAYAVVLTRTLQPAAGAPNPFATEAEATAYFTQQLAQWPATVGELQVVPVYQLDVSAPSTAATLATI